MQDAELHVWVADLFATIAFCERGNSFFAIPNCFSSNWSSKFKPSLGVGFKGIYFLDFCTSRKLNHMSMSGGKKDVN